MPIDPQHELRNAFGQAWDKLVLDTDTEPNLSLIAAYVDGRLNDMETRQLAGHLLECPAAWEIMEQMLPDGMPFPTPVEEETGQEADGGQIVPLRHPSESQDRSTNSVSQPGGTRPTWILAMAAGWLAAIVGGGIIWQLRDEATEMRTRLARAEQAEARVAQLESEKRVRAAEVAQLELAELAQQVSAYRPVYLIGEADLGMVRVAMQQNRVRGPEDPTAAAAANIERTLNRIRTALEDATDLDAPEQNVASRLSQIASLIVAGSLPQAETLLLELESGPVSQSASVRNARAVWQIAQANRLTSDDAEPLLQAAEVTLREIAEAGEAPAWLNLARLYLDQGRTTEASLAALEFLDTEPDPAIAELIRQRFGLP